MLKEMLEDDATFEDVKDPAIAKKAAFNLAVKTVFDCTNNDGETPLMRLLSRSSADPNTELLRVLIEIKASLRLGRMPLLWTGTTPLLSPCSPLRC